MSASEIIALEPKAIAKYRDELTEILDHYSKEYFNHRENYPMFLGIRKMLGMSTAPLHGAGKIRDALYDHIFNRHCLPQWWLWDSWGMTFRFLRVREFDLDYRRMLVAARYNQTISVIADPQITVTHEQADLLSRIAAYEPR